MELGVSLGCNDGSRQGGYGRVAVPAVRDQREAIASASGETYHRRTGRLGAKRHADRVARLHPTQGQTRHVIDIPGIVRPAQGHGSGDGSWARTKGRGGLHRCPECKKCRQPEPTIGAVYRR